MNQKILELLITLPVLRNVEKKFLEKILTKENIKEYRKGEFIFHQNEISGGLYIVLQGTLNVILENDPHRIISTINEHSVFGEIGLLIHAVRSAGIQAKEASSLLYFDDKIFKKLIDNNDSNALRMAYNISLIIAERLKNTSEKITSLAETDKKTREIEAYKDKLFAETLI